MIFMMMSKSKKAGLIFSAGIFYGGLGEDLEGRMFAALLQRLLASKG